MKTIKKCPILSAFTTLFLGTVVYGAALSGKDILMNEVMIQLNWCEMGNAICLLEKYIWFGLGLLIIGIVLQLSFDWHYKRNWFEKKTKAVIEEKHSEIIEVKTKKENIDKQEAALRKLRTTSITEGKEYSNIRDYASIRVENISNDEIHCFAKLTKFSMIDRKTIRKPYMGDKIEVFPIDTINPRGSYLQWDDSKESAVLKNGFPHTIRLIDNKACLLFFETPSYYIFRRDILDGIFRIEIELLEFQNNKFVKIKTIKDTLLVRALVQNAKLQGFHLNWEKPNKKWAGQT